MLNLVRHFVCCHEGNVNFNVLSFVAWRCHFASFGQACDKVRTAARCWEYACYCKGTSKPQPRRFRKGVERLSERLVSYFLDVRRSLNKSRIWHLELSSDSTIRTHLSALYDTLLEQNLLRIVEPYSVVEVEYVAQQVGQGRQAVELKCVSFLQCVRVFCLNRVLLGCRKWSWTKYSMVFWIRDVDVWSSLTSQRRM